MCHPCKLDFYIHFTVAFRRDITSHKTISKLVNDGVIVTKTKQNASLTVGVTSQHAGGGMMAVGSDERDLKGQTYVHVP